MSHDEIVASVRRADHFLRALGIVAGVLLAATLVFTAYVSWSTSVTLIEQAEIRAEQRMEAQELGDQRLADAMICLTGLLLIPPDERTDETVHRVCPPELIDGVRDRLGGGADDATP